ncbi:probable CCR4-associated factor 1 homolog 2 [Prosopis cineraria]|uniref:probable CCR4-associated factor 1 homolog 2 n=1 Tax=Prosopis cineraria TaxID=364024 RepID=UPI00240F6481|nr:probable CCR4-associated factor 1 homolog 2 [Prosopis cineraria]
MSSVEGSDSVQIVDVWKENMEQEFSVIRAAKSNFPYVSLNTKFSGSLFTVRSYGALSGNLGLAKLIQVGLTLSDEQGNIPMIMSSTTHEAKQRVWQFNFCEFDPKTDPKSRDIIETLIYNGIDFEKNKNCGIKYSDFAGFLMSSRLVQDDKLLTGKKNLPEKEQEFFKILKDFFPVSYDLNYLIKFTTNLRGGLEDVARVLGEKRVGPTAQAGSDSLLTSRVFKKLKHEHVYFNGAIPETCRGVLSGLAGIEL